ncbi:MAG: DUF2281 domain-containing protein [Methylococcales bacterium]|jgi:tRNA splicing endonuclease|nr:DUF2281 domain-containing protein [Methylococcales bacterium]
MKNYAQIQQKIEVLNEIELAEVIDFIDFLRQKKTQKQRRLEIFKTLQNAGVAEKYGDALTWQKETRQDNVLTR